MLMGLPPDRRAHAILVCRLLADRAEDANFSLQSIGEIALDLAAHLLDETMEQPVPQPSARPRLRVIPGGRN